ncbi:MAG TPA: dienelactone hydrolase family protein [Azospirillaceae bacterium]|nr:dienelactone hydrolase family protein [Azospirillaceae bacterium]
MATSARPVRRLLAALALALGFALPATAQTDLPDPDAVATFDSLDDAHTSLNGYLWIPDGKGPFPSIVVMHGCRGVYAGEPYDATVISRPYREWAQRLTQRGFLVLLVDGFRSRFANRTDAEPNKLTSVCDMPDDQRQDTIDETTVRPLDAYAALRWLRGRPEVRDDAIALMGFASGANAALSAMAANGPATAILGGNWPQGFRAGVAFYPGCEFQNRYRPVGYRVYGPVRLFVGGADTRTPPHPHCDKLVHTARTEGGDIDIRFYANAGHGFDRQPGAARDDSIARTLDFLTRVTRGQPGGR